MSHEDSHADSGYRADQGDLGRHDQRSTKDPAPGQPERHLYTDLATLSIHHSTDEIERGECRGPENQSAQDPPHPLVTFDVVIEKAIRREFVDRCDRDAESGL